MNSADSSEESMRLADYWGLGVIPWIFLAFYLLTRPVSWVYREVKSRV